MKPDSLMRKSLVVAVLAIGAGVAILTGQAENRLPTPEVAGFQTVDVEDGTGYVMRAQLGDTGEYVGLSLLCRGSGEVEAGVYFGGFPSSRQPVQLAVRDIGGRVERFGPVVKGGPEAGFHSPRITEVADVKRFVDVALQPGSLVSNGYRSFWNRASAADNRMVWEEFVGCARIGDESR